MRRAAGAFLLLSLLLGIPAVSAAAIGCPVNGAELLDGQWLLVGGDCAVDGDITLSGTSFLIVTDARFVLRGNLTGRDGAIVYVQRSEFIVDNRFNAEWSMTMLGDSMLWFSQTVFRSNQSTGSNYFMAYFGRDRSKLRVTDSSLPTSESWLLARIGDQAQAYTSGSSDLPSEILPFDQSTIRVDPGSRTSLWLLFDVGSRAALVLPDQRTGPYSFAFGRNTPNVVGIDYDVRIVDSQVRLGVTSRPGSNLVVVGKGKGPVGSGEVSIGYTLSGNQTPETITGLRPGYQAYTRLTHQSRNLILYNVEVDPIGWNVYVSFSNAPVTIRDSILNDVAAFPGGMVEIQRSILQWAVLGSTGAGSSMVVRDSHIFSQVIHGVGDGSIELHDSVVHGSVLEALDDSTIRGFGGLLLPSGEVDPCDMGTGLTPAAVPLCNPFLAPGVLPVISTSGNGQVILNGPPPSGVTDLHLVGWTEPLSVGVGGEFTYNVQTGNAGPDPATGVFVRFRTPSQATVESFSSICSTAGRDVLCNVGQLPPLGSSDWLTVRYRTSSALTPAVGEVFVIGDQVDPDPANHTLRLSNSITQ